MKKILILTRAFPPSNRTAAFRAHSFARYLHRYGYYPIVITRYWGSGSENDQDPAGTEVRHEKKEGYEVYYIPFAGTLSRRPAFRSGPFHRVALLTEIYFGKKNFFNPNYALYRFADSFLKQNSDVNKLLVTAPHFDLLKYGHMLKRRHKIDWIADYRDEWTSEGGLYNTGIREDASFLAKQFYKWFLSFRKQRKRELRWVSSAALFTSVSPQAVRHLEEMTRLKGELVLNGFDPENYPATPPANYPDLTIAYAGWLYSTQKIEVLLEAVKKLASETADLKLRLLFIGGRSFPEMADRLTALMQGYEKYLLLTERVSKEESINMQLRSSLLLLCAHSGKDGIPSSKLYEYLGTGKKILLCPGDRGIIESTLRESGQGIICNTSEETLAQLRTLYQNRSELSLPSPANPEIEKYSREYQVKQLAEALNKIA